MSLSNFPLTAPTAVRIELGSGSLKGNFGFGARRDYDYDVPDGVITVTLDFKDKSPDNTLNFGVENGDVTLNWDKPAKKARVHAWVNGAFPAPNEMQWTVYAWIRV